MTKPEMRAIQRIAKWMLEELDNGFLDVVLVPAAEKNNEQASIRVAQWQNAFWYREFVEQFTNCRGIWPHRMRRPRTFIVKSQVRRALVNIISGRRWDTSYIERLLEYINRCRSNHRHKKRPTMALAAYVDNGLKMPF